jgi:hypothetical protein
MQDCAGVRLVPTLIASMRRGLAIRLQAMSAPQLAENLGPARVLVPVLLLARVALLRWSRLSLHHEQQGRLDQAVQATGASNSTLISSVRLTSVGAGTRSASTLGY